MRTVFSIFVLLLAAGCGGAHESTAPAAATPTTQASAPLPDRDPALAHKLVAEGAVLIDVRTPEEYAARHVEGAVNVPVDQIESNPDQVSKLTGGDPHKPIVVYCGSGHRAGRAKAALTSHGFDRVTNVGGIDDYDKKSP